MNPKSKQYKYKTYAKTDECAYILLTNKKWWNRLCDRDDAGETLHAFVRRSAAGPKSAKLILFYVTHPFKEIRGFGEFIERITDDADSLWRTHGHETCLKSYEEYIGFLQGRTKVTFIRFKNFRRLPVAIPTSVISKVTGIGRMPRGGKYINKETAQKLM